MKELNSNINSTTFKKLTTRMKNNNISELIHQLFNILPIQQFIYSHTHQIIINTLNSINKQFNKILLYQNGIGIVITISNNSIEYIEYDEEASINLNNKSNTSNTNNINNINYKENTFDLIIINMSLHFVNQLPNLLKYYNTILKKDGLFIATILGGATLRELRYSMLSIDTIVHKAAIMRIMPMLNYDTSIKLMKYGNMEMITVDVEKIEARYSSFIKLLYDVRKLGNYLNEEIKYMGHTKLQFFAEVEKEYVKLISKQSISKKSNILDTSTMYFPAYYEILTISGTKNK